jgi:general secretion pathway protein C
MARAFDTIIQKSKALAQPGWRNGVLSIRTLVFVIGKISLFAAVGFAYLIGDMLRQSEKDSVQDFDMSLPEGNIHRKQKLPLETYSAILNSNIFGKTKSETKPQVKTQPPSPLKLRLVAVNEISTGSRMAIIEDTQKNNQEVFDLNDTVFNQGKLVDIGKDSIKIEHNGSIETLAMQDIDSGSGDSGQTGDGKSDFTVSEDELSAALANLPQLLSQARAVPYFRNGQSIGMRLFAIRTGSMYEKLGLKNGDIVLAVNDNSLSDPAQALKLFEQLKSEHSINVKLERNSQVMDMHYSIR